MSKSAFKAVVLGVHYDDRREYEKAARAAGFRSGAGAGRGGRTGDWKVGLLVGFRTTDGQVRRGQVWSKGNRKGVVLLALEGGVYARVDTLTGLGRLIAADGSNNLEDEHSTGSIASAVQVAS